VTPTSETPTRGTLLGTSVAIFLIRFFPTLANVLALLWLARTTPAAYYGRYQSFWVQWQVLHVLACLGLPTLVLTYPLAQLRWLRQAVQPGALAALGAWVLLLAGTFGAWQWWGSSPFAPWQAAGFLVLNVPIAVLEAYALVERQYRPVALVNGGYAVLFVISHALLVGHYFSSPQLMGCLLAGNVLRLAALARLATQDAPGLAPAALPWGAVCSHRLRTALNGGSISWRLISCCRLRYLPCTSMARLISRFCRCCWGRRVAHCCYTLASRPAPMRSG
jgi:hypothetical protein